MSVVEAPVLLVSDVEVEDGSISSCSHSEEGDSGYKPATSLSDSDKNQGKDSGIDCGPEEFVPPDDETAGKILEAVEFYLSDANVLRDPFLLKHVRRNKEGFVSVKLISSFRKIRNISRCWRAVAHSIQKSKLLTLNSEGTKVRRLTPLPNYDETVQSRTVVVYDLPGSKVSVESVSEMFSKCGDIALVRILRPGTSISTDVKKFFNKNPEVQSKDCCLVEFEEFVGAQKALALYGAMESSPKVVSLSTKDSDGKSKPSSPTKNQSKDPDSPKKDNPKKKKKTKKLPYGSKSFGTDDSENDLNKKNEQRSRRSSSGSLGYCSSGSSGYLSSSPADNWFLRRHSYNPNNTYLEASTPSFASLANRNHLRGSRDRLSKENLRGSRDHLSKENLWGSRDHLNKDKGDPEKKQESSPSQSPWRRRKELLAESSSLASSSANVRLPVKAIRLPKGPDGTMGFQFRQLVLLPSTAE